MTESNPTQVILTDDGIKIIKAQNTANNAASGVTNLNDPNLMSVIEKQNSITQFAGLTSQYNVLIQNAKDDGIDTTSVTAAYNNLNKFMADILADPNHASDVDRATYKKYQDAYNEELVKLQNTLQNNANNKFDSAASAASQAASTASQAFSQANSAIGVANGATAEITKLSGDINLRVTKDGLIDQINIQAGNTLISSSGQLTLSGKTIYFDSTNPVIIPSANIDKLLIDKKLTAADVSANTFTTNNGTFTVDKDGAVVASNLTIRGVTNLVYNAALLGGSGSNIPGWTISNNAVCWAGNLHDGVPSIGFNASTDSGVWANFAQTKLHPLNGATGQPFSASVWFKEYGSDTSLQYSFTLAFFDSNGNRINGAYAEQVWNGISSEQDWRYVTINNAVAPSNAAFVGLQYFAYNGHGNACFSSPMLTQTAQATGYQPDTGNVVSAGEIDGSVINGSTINTPALNLGLNGTFTEDFDYTQPASLFLPKKNKGTLTFNHGVLQSEGNMQTYVGGQWGGMNDSLVFQSGIDNAQWTEIAPGYSKMVLYKQDGTSVAQRTYSDPTGFYYTSTLGDKSYLGNVLQTPQVQTASVLTKYIGPSDGELRLQIGSNGNHYGLQVGSYAGAEAVLSDFIYDFTSSASANVHITDGGHLARSTSASKYKYNIKNPDIETTLGDRLLNVHMAMWNDKHAVDSYAEQLSTGEEREKSSIDKYYGLIAEQLRDAGLDMFIDYGKNHEIEGIQYDRAWIPLLSVIRRLNDKVNEYELRLSKLEGANK